MSTYVSNDLVKVWQVPLKDKIHVIEFDHGTISGKRTIRVNGKVVLHRDKMFKLVGSERFNIDKNVCTISIDATASLTYEYSLDVNGKPYQKFVECQAQKLRAWNVYIPGMSDPFRVIFDKDSLEVYVNGQQVETAGEFEDESTSTHFELGGGHKAYIQAVSSGKRREGIIHTLIVNDNIVPEAID